MTNLVSSRQTPLYHKAVYSPRCCPPSSVCLRCSIGFLSKIITAVRGMNRQRCSQGPRSGGGEGQVSSSEAGALCLSQKRDLIQNDDEFSNRNNSTEPGSQALTHIWLDNNVKCSAILMQKYLPTQAWKHSGRTQKCYSSCSFHKAEGNVCATWSRPLESYWQVQVKRNNSRGLLALK